MLDKSHFSATSVERINQLEMETNTKLNEMKQSIDARIDSAIAK